MGTVQWFIRQASLGMECSVLGDQNQDVSHHGYVDVIIELMDKTSAIKFTMVSRKFNSNHVLQQIINRGYAGKYDQLVYLLGISFCNIYLNIISL